MVHIVLIWKGFNMMDIWLNNQEDTDNAAAANDNDENDVNQEIEDMGLPYPFVQNLINK